MSAKENGMKRTILILVVLIALVFLAQSKSLINLGGRDGNLLFGELTNNSTSNPSINISQNASALHLGGDDGNILLHDLINESKNLSDWGSKPPKAPLPPKYDPKSAQTYAVLRMNHMGY
jgi:hypothetical protein